MMSVSLEETKEEKVYLSEEQERLLNHHVLTPGYIRNLTSNDMNSVPEAIVKLCTEFVKPINFEEEAEDPVNFISDSDKVQCEQCKLEGNRYFKAKSFQFAITKYTVAVRYNPNNHLIFSNRSYCHYLLGNYDDALSDIKECVRIQPAFVKGWFRYGLILEKLEHFGKAGMAFKTAFNLSRYEMKEKNKKPDEEGKKRTLMLCKHRYLKFMKMLKHENKEDALKYINGFGSNCGAMDREDALKFEELLQQFQDKMRSNTLNDEWNEKEMEELLQDSVITKNFEERDFVRFVEQSRFRQCAEENAFRFYEGEHEWYHNWTFGWSSTSVIEQNKRQFMVTLCAGEYTVCSPRVFGKPTAEQMIEMLLRAMTFTYFEPIQAMRCIKPMAILFSWRMREEFPTIQAVMGRFGIFCELETKERTAYYCEQNGTRVDGYNHL